MKKLFALLAIASGIAFTSCEKSSLSGSSDEIVGRRGADDPTLPPPANLPAAVLSSFNSQFPTATRMEWQAEDGNTWKVKFFVGTVRWVAVYRADGTRISLTQK